MALELLHETGHTHNDIKNANIMLDNYNETSFDLILIDYGYCDTFRDANGNHLPCKHVKNF